MGNWSDSDTPIESRSFHRDAKGSRIGGAQAAFGAMLSIKLLLDLSSGEVVAEGKQRTGNVRLAGFSICEQPEQAGEVENLAILHSNAADINESHAGESKFQVKYHAVVIPIGTGLLGSSDNTSTNSRESNPFTGAPHHSP